MELCIMQSFTPKGRGARLKDPSSDLTSVRLSPGIAPAPADNDLSAAFRAALGNGASASPIGGKGKATNTPFSPQALKAKPAARPKPGPAIKGAIGPRSGHK